MRAFPATALGLLALAVLTGCHGRQAGHDELVLKVVGPTDRAQLDRTARVLSDRIESLGLHHVQVKRGPGGRITIVTSHPIASQKRRLLTKRGFLGFYDLEADLAPVSKDASGNVLAATDPVRLATRARSADPARKPASFVLVDRGGLLAGPERTRDDLMAVAAATGGVRKGAHVVGVPAHETLVECTSSSTTGCPGSQRPEGTYWYVFKYYPSRASNPIPEATGADLLLSSISAHAASEPSEGSAFVQIGFKSEGGKKFHEVTRAEAARGQALADAAGKGGSSDVPTVVEFAQHFAIVLDNRLLSTPYIDYKQDPDGIDPTKSGAIISNLPIDQAKGLAIMLRSGALPFHVVIAP